MMGFLFCGNGAVVACCVVAGEHCLCHVAPKRVKYLPIPHLLGPASRGEACGGGVQQGISCSLEQTLNMVERKWSRGYC